MKFFEQKNSSLIPSILTAGKFSLKRDCVVLQQLQPHHNVLTKSHKLSIAGNFIHESKFACIGNLYIIIIQY